MSPYPVDRVTQTLHRWSAGSV